MKNLVRGGLLALLSCVFVALIYAQGFTGGDLIIANNSQENSIENTEFNVPLNTTDDDDDKKLVKTTGSARAVGAGASKGAFNASAYCFSGHTALGHGVKRGLIAADPRVLRLGSRIY